MMHYGGASPAVMGRVSLCPRNPSHIGRPLAAARASSRRAAAWRRPAPRVLAAAADVPPPAAAAGEGTREEARPRPPPPTPWGSSVAAATGADRWVSKGPGPWWVRRAHPGYELHAVAEMQASCYRPPAVCGGLCIR